MCGCVGFLLVLVWLVVFFSLRFPFVENLDGHKKC